jgi:hypothetical protein
MSIEDMIDKNEVHPGEVQREEVAPEQNTAGFNLDLSFLKTPTGEGELYEYMNHTLNFNQSKGMARIIRGLTGFLGNMNFAIVDIFIGVLEFAKPKKAVAIHDDQIH